MDVEQRDPYTGMTVDELASLIDWEPLGYGCLGTVDLVRVTPDFVHYNLLIIVPWKLNGKGGGIRLQEELSTIPYPTPPDFLEHTRNLMLDLMREEVLELVGEPIEREEAEAFLSRIDEIES